MTLIPQWRAVLVRAWSVLLLYLVMAINGAELVLYAGGIAIPGLPLWARAAITFAIGALAIWSRLILQPQLTKRVERTSEQFDVDYFNDPKGPV